MYASYFGLRETPFRRISVVGQVYLGSAFESAWSQLVGAIREGAPGVLLTGAAGTGKTRLLLHLRTSIGQEQPVFYLSCCPLGVEGFIGSAASALRIKLTSGRDVDVRDAFREALGALGVEGKPPIILIDDADGLSEEVLAALASLFELGADVPLARVVFAGSPRMEDVLSRPALETLGECLSPRMELGALDPQEVGAYIRFALEMVGHRGPDIFSPEAVARIATQTRGVIHQINVLGGAALTIAHDREERWVTEDTVLVAIRDVMGLELPGDANEMTSANAGQMDTGPKLGQDWWEAQYLYADDAVETWLRKSRPWRFAAMGLGGSVALAAMLVLLGLLPLGPSNAAAKQRGHLATKVDLDEHITELEQKIDTAVSERGHLEARLTQITSQRRRLADGLGSSPAQPESGGEEILGGLRLDIENDEHFRALRAEFEGGASKGAKRETSARVIMVPKPKPRVGFATASASGRDAAQSYVVQEGDNLWRIAATHGLTMEQLLAINGISDANFVFTGQRLRLVEERPTVEYNPTPPVEVALLQPEAAERWYEVRPGDSLYGIGRKTNTDPLDLKRWNELADADHLIVGQRIQLFPGGEL